MFAQITQKRVGQQLAMVIVGSDGAYVVMAPTVTEPIKGGFQINAQQSQEADDLAQTLRISMLKPMAIKQVCMMPAGIDGTAERRNLEAANCVMNGA